MNSTIHPYFKMNGKNIKPVKLGEKLLQKLDEIKEQEKIRGRDKTSYRVAGEILSTRIDLVGGLKKTIGN